jgi:hypothetical protein
LFSGAACDSAGCAWGPWDCAEAPSQLDASATITTPRTPPQLAIRDPLEELEAKSLDQARNIIRDLAEGGALTRDDEHLVEDLEHVPGVSIAELTKLTAQVRWARSTGGAFMCVAGNR